jgi:hypothetical protein
VDAVVLATMRRAHTRLASELANEVPRLFVIGDAMSPRYLFKATYEGQRFARLIGEPDAPRDMREALGLFKPQSPDVFPTSAANLYAGSAV